MTEEWRPVPGYDGYYEVSNQGRVRSGKGLMKPWPVNGYGHLSVDFRRVKPYRKFQVHRLVLETFVGPCPEGMECLHKNGDPSDNRLENLRWGTSSENALDTVRHGNHYSASKVLCPQGHRLEPPNLVEWHVKRGRRSCLACSRARGYIRNHPEADLQQVADDYYRRIACGSGY